MRIVARIRDRRRLTRPRRNAATPNSTCLRFTRPETASMPASTPFVYHPPVIEASDPGIVRTMIFGIVVAAVFGLGFFGVLAAALAKLGWRKISRTETRAAKIFAALALAGAACMLYGRFIEADWLSVTKIEVETDKLPAGARLRIVHLTDLHVLDRTRALDELPARVNALDADLLVFTGDSIATPESAPLFRELLSAIRARHGRFAVRGNHDVWYFKDVDLFGGGVAHELTANTATRAAGLFLCGAAYDREHEVADCLTKNREGYRVAVFHTPDLVEDLEPLAPDLYLAGHTHGGQVRLPFFGAIITLSKFDKKYEMGRYTVGRTTLFVSRGVGVEPPPAPRVRFWCRPEIAVIDVIGKR
jgi:uncharacterized protein